MTDPPSHAVVLFDSVSHALHAEKLVKNARIPCKLIPVPRHLSSDCGVCLRFDAADAERIEAALRGRLESFEIRML